MATEVSLMASLNPYHLPVILVAVIGVCVVGVGAWGVSEVYPEYTYIVNGPEDPYYDFDEQRNQPIQFEELSDTGQEAFLASLNGDGSYDSSEKASTIKISGDKQEANYVEYNGQIYEFIAWAPPAGSGAAVTICALISLLGIGIILLAFRLKKKGSFIFPTALNAGVFASSVTFLTHHGNIYYVNFPWSYLMILLTPLLTWRLLRRIERDYDVSFSHRMRGEAYQ